MTATLPMTVEFGHIERTPVHFDDMDAMGVLHNARYGVLVERAVVAFWTRHGHSFHGSRPTTPDAFSMVKEYWFGNIPVLAGPRCPCLMDLGRFGSP